MKRAISTRTHGVLDYLMGGVLIVVPLLLTATAVEPAAVWTPVIIGASIIAYSLLTRYEFGAAKLIPMPAHLWLDVIGGVALAASPWVFGFAGELLWIPYVAVGLLEIGAAAMTDTRPSARTHARGRAPSATTTAESRAARPTGAASTGRTAEPRGLAGSPPARPLEGENEAARSRRTGAGREQR